MTLTVHRPAHREGGIRAHFWRQSPLRPSECRDVNEGATASRVDPSHDTLSETRCPPSEAETRSLKRAMQPYPASLSESAAREPVPDSPAHSARSRSNPAADSCSSGISPARPRHRNGSSRLPERRSRRGKPRGRSALCKPFREARFSSRLQTLTLRRLFNRYSAGTQRSGDGDSRMTG